MIYIFEWLAVSLGTLILFIPASVIGYLMSRDKGAIIGAAFASVVMNIGYIRSLSMLKYVPGTSTSQINIELTTFASAIGFAFLYLFTQDRDSTFSLKNKFSNILLLFGTLLICESISKGITWWFLNRNGVDDKHAFGIMVGHSIWGAILILLGWLNENRGGFANGPSQHVQPDKYDPAQLFDPYDVAGREVISGKVSPSIWARALAEGGDEQTVKGRYVSLRVAELDARVAAAAQADQVR